MKQASEVIKEVVLTAKKAEAAFGTARFTKLLGIFHKYMTEDDLKPINAVLQNQHRRTLTIEDITRIAYVHARSISENDGRSPYTRVISYAKANGHDYDNLHVKVVTELLLKMEFMKLMEGENRKEHLCRKYALSPDIKTEIAA